jgi:hypothetical protein
MSDTRGTTEAAPIVTTAGSVKLKLFRIERVKISQTYTAAIEEKKTVKVYILENRKTFFDPSRAQNLIGSLLHQ